MSAKTRLVRWQKTREITTKKKYSGESSAYNEFVQKHNKKDDGELREYPEANPDVLCEPDQPVENLTRKIIKRDWHEIKFSKREQEVLALAGKGLTQEAIGKKLGIKRVSVQVILARIQKKGEKWLVIKRANNSTYSDEEENS